MALDIDDAIQHHIEWVPYSLLGAIKMGWVCVLANFAECTLALVTLGHEQADMKERMEGGQKRLASVGAIE